MGVESVGVEAASYGPKRFPHLTDDVSRPSPGLFAEVLESKGLKFWAGANRTGPYAFGAAMATLAGERSNSEGTHSSSQNPSGNFRFGAFTGASSLSSTDGGYVNRTVSVSELLAFRNRGGKVIDKQTPTVFKDSIPAASSLSTVNFSCGGTAINGSTNAAYRSFSNSLPKVVSDAPSLVADGRESSAAASKDSNYATSSFAALTTGLKPSTSGSSSVPFVFSAGASDTGPLKPGTQTSVPPGRLFSGSSRPPAQSNIPTDGLFSGISRPGVQSNVPLDSSLSGSMRPAFHRNASNDTPFLDSSETTVQSNVFSDTLSSVPTWLAAQVSSSIEPSCVGSSNSGFQSKVAFEMQSAGLFKPTGESDIPFEELLAANTAQGVVGGLSISTTQRNRFAECGSGTSVNISWKLNQLDTDKGINPLPELKKLDLNKDGERVVYSTAFAAKTEVEQSLKKLDIDKGDSLPLKMEKLVVNKEGKYIFPGKNTFVFGGQSTSASGDRTPSSTTFVFGAAKTRAGTISECTENRRSEEPPTTNFSSAFKFSAAGEVKPPFSKAKKDKFLHRPLRPGLRSNVKGKKSASTSSSGRSEVANPSPSRDGVSMDISPQSTNEASTSSQSGFHEIIKSLVPEHDEGESDEESGGASEVNSMNELEVSILKLRAAVSVLNFGPGYNRTKETSSSTAFSNVKKQDSWLCGNMNTEEASSSMSYGQGWKGTPVADTQSVERAEQENNLDEQENDLAEEENNLAQHGDVMNEVNERGDVNYFSGKNSGAGRNEDGTETSSGPEGSNYNADGQPRAEGEGKGSPFTFTASPTGMSTSNLRRRTRKVLRSVGRVKQADNASVPVLQLDRSNSMPISTIKSHTWSGTASLGGLGGSGYREGANAQGVVSGGDAEQVCERWRLRGNQAYAKGDFLKAEEFYSLGAGSVSPHETSQSCIRASMLCYSNRAATRMVVGRMREALADCLRAMAVDPSFVRVHLRAAGCHLALGETELAASAFKECLRQAQEASKVDSKVLADASDGLKKAQQVAEYGTQARKLVHNNSSGDSVTALRLVNEALLASPQSEWLLELKAYTLASLQRFTEAIQVCEQSLALAERNLTTLEGASNRFENSPLGWRRRITVKANFHLGKLEEALEQLQQLQEDPFSMVCRDPGFPGALSAEMTLHSKAVIRDLLRHKLEGNKAFQAGKFAEALEHYTAALARNGESRPFCAVCLCNRAAASQALGLIADAIADCSRAIALDPLYAKAISRRASLHEKVRDYGQSCCDLGRLIAIFEKQHSQVQGIRSLRIDGSTRPTTSSVEELQQAKERLIKAEDEMKKGCPLDHYGILGLESGCSASDIKKAYRKAALRHHPDKAGQFLLRSGDIGDDPLKDAMDETVRKDGERLIDEVRKDSEQLFKLIGEAYAVLSDPAKRSRYDSEEELRKLRTRSSDLAKNVNTDRKHSRTSDGANVGQAKGGWSSCSSAGESGSQSRASRQRDRWEGFNYQYQRWHPGPDAAQPDVYARRGRPTGSTFGSSHRSTSWRWEEYPWDDV